MLCLTRSFVISLILIAVLVAVSSATEWEGPLPDSMNELFEYTEEALDLEGYRTRELTINEDIFIQIPDEIGLALNYDGSTWEDIVHMCVGRIKFETLSAKLLYLYPNGEAFFDATDPDLTIGTGYAYGTFAFPKPSSEGFSCSDINTYPGALNATGVLFLP